MAAQITPEALLLQQPGSRYHVLVRVCSAQSTNNNGLQHGLPNPFRNMNGQQCACSRHNTCMRSPGWHTRPICTPALRSRPTFSTIRARWYSSGTYVYGTPPMRRYWSGRPGPPTYAYRIVKYVTDQYGYDTTRYCAVRYGSTEDALQVCVRWSSSSRFGKGTCAACRGRRTGAYALAALCGRFTRLTHQREKSRLRCSDDGGDKPCTYRHGHGR